MRVNWKRLCKKVCKVVGAPAPSDNELLLLDAISYPVISHVDAFSTFWFDGVQRDPDGAFIITENNCWRLGIP